jgi:DNA-directed RNA polymerase specialized sigma24 family protein
MYLRNDAGLLAQRRPQSRMTNDFMALWSDVDEPLRCYLGAMGLSRHDIDDITQETATRAIESGVVANNPDALRPWAFVVAKRLAFDLFRTRRRWVDIDQASGPDISQEVALRRVEERHLLRTVASAVAALPKGERSSVVDAPIGRTADEQNRVNAARYRARRRLRQLVGPLVVAVAWVRRQSHGPVAGAMLAAAALPLVALSLVHQGRADGPTTFAAGRVPRAVDAGLMTRAQTVRAVSVPSLSHQPPSGSVRPSSAATNSEKIVLSAIGPTDGSGTGVAVGHHPPPPGHHLLCVGGSDLPGAVCVDLPRGVTSDVGRDPTTLDR